jgi:hypothetical protein
MSDILHPEMLMQDQKDRIVEKSEDKGWSLIGKIVVMNALPVAHAYTRNKKKWPSSVLTGHTQAPLTQKL